MTGTVLGSVEGDNDHVPLASQAVQLAGHDGGHHLPHAVEHGQARPEGVTLGPQISIFLMTASNI